MYPLRPTCFVYRGGAQSNHVTRETYVIPKVCDCGDMAKHIIWDDLRGYGHVERYLAGECEPI